MEILKEDDRGFVERETEPGAAPLMFVTPCGRHSSQAELALIRAEAEVAPPPVRTAAATRKRAIHAIIALLLLVFLAPVLLIVAALVALTDPGPVFYRQKRVGKDGKPFDCLKFRTMRVDAEARLVELLAQDPVLRAEWEATRKLEDDPRITPIGHFLRLSSLDELPQLVNVVAGDINLVGPRPIIASELPCYGRYLRHYLSVRPGLTGMWQISGRSSTTYRRRVAADVLYVRRRSLALDCYIVVATVPAVLFAKGAV
ncbi:sugar transferase [Altererythrobacter sp. CAU 1778]